MTEKKYETIPVELSDEEFLTIAKMAHDRNITFNQMVEIILWKYIGKEKERQSRIPTLTDEVKSE
jgi:hypothetical protein